MSFITKEEWIDHFKNDKPIKDDIKKSRFSSKGSLVEQIEQSIKEMSVGESKWMPEILGPDDVPVGISKTRMSLRHVADRLFMNFKTKRHGFDLFITRIG